MVGILFLALVHKHHKDVLETWLNNISPINMFNIPNYSFIHSPHKSKSGGGGGVGIYIHNIYTFIERPDPSIFIE